jgi:ATP-dependent DNA helicase DinG
MKGRSNYACLYRVAKAENQPILDGLDEMDYFEEIRHWARESQTGDRAELVNLPENLSFWGRINAKSKFVSDKSVPISSRVLSPECERAPKTPTS